MSAEHEQRTRQIEAAELLEDDRLGLALRIAAGRGGLNRPIVHPRIQKSGLGLAGHFHGLVPTRIQVLGETEISYLESLDEAAQEKAADGFFSLCLSCVIVTRGIDPPRAIVRAAERTETPLFVSEARSSLTITAVHALLDDRLAPRTSLHGVLVDVFGVGLLITGKSSVGKSECALELVMRGHRLVADDIVECDFRPPRSVFGQPAHLLRHHIEVRGLGILNIKDLFGVTSVRERKRIDVLVDLVEWQAETEYDRMGIDDRFHDILGVKVRKLVVPVRPGRSMGSILEIAARNHLLREAGHHAAREFFGRIEGELLSRRVVDEGETSPPPRVQRRDEGERG